MAVIGLQSGGWVTGTKWARTIPHLVGRASEGGGGRWGGGLLFTTHHPPRATTPKRLGPLSINLVRGVTDPEVFSTGKSGPLLHMRTTTFALSRTLLGRLGPNLGHWVNSTQHNFWSQMRFKLTFRPIIGFAFRRPRRCAMTTLRILCGVTLHATPNHFPLKW